MTGPAASAADSVKIFKGIDSTLLYATLGVVIVLLLLTYRSPILWLLPIISAGVSLIAAEAVIYLLVVHEGLVVNGQTAGILVVLVLGASTDYALLLIARYREELRRHEDRHEAMAVAMRRAGPAIFASGLTVIAGMLCLLVADSADISGLGPVAAIGIAVGLLSMITLLPALLVITGRWVFWPLRPRYGSQDPTAAGPWARIGSRIARHPRRVWIVTAVLLAVASLGLIGFRFGALTQAQSYRGTPSAVAGEKVLAQHFPAGAGEPVYVIGQARDAAPLRAALARTRGIAAVSPPEVRDGLVLLQGTLAVPPDSQAAYTVVSRVRAAVHAIPGADAKVGGSTAINADVQHYAIRDRNVIIPLVLVVVLVILALLLRAVVAPLILIGTVILSFGAALGLSALAFRHVFGFAGADNAMPLFAFVFLVALGIDYNIFLMTRVREETHQVRDAPRDAGRPGRHRRRDHLGGPGAGRHVRHARHAAAGHPHRDRVHGGARGAAGHPGGPLRAGHRADPGRRAVHVVAEQPGGPGRRCARRRARPVSCPAGDRAARPGRLRGSPRPDRFLPARTVDPRGIRFRQRRLPGAGPARGPHRSCRRSGGSRRAAARLRPAGLDPPGRGAGRVGRGGPGDPARRDGPVHRGREVAARPARRRRRRATRSAPRAAGWWRSAASPSTRPRTGPSSSCRRWCSAAGTAGPG